MTNSSLQKKMNYLTVIIIILVLFASDSVFGAEVHQIIKSLNTAGLLSKDKLSLGNLTIEVRKNYKAKISGIIGNRYIYELHDTLELKCRAPEELYLEWTDEKNKISQKSCSKTNDFTLILEKLGDDDNRNIFMCNSTNEFSTVTLILRTRTSDSSRKLQEQNSVCHKIVRDINRNCLQHLRQDTVNRVQTQCPTEMREDLFNNTKNIDDDDSILIIGDHKEPPNYLQDESEDSSMLVYAVTFISVFISLAIITFCIFRCYKKVKERKNNEPVYAEPNAVQYAELQVINNIPPNLPNRNDPPYSKIIGVLTPAASE